MAKFLQVIRDLVLLVVRVALGAMFVWHGWMRWQTQGVQAQVDYLSQFAVPHPTYVAWTLIIFELVGGIFLIVGVITPIVALLVVAEQALTIAYTNFYHPGPVALSGGTLVEGYEYNAALGAIGLLLLVYGAGRISVDQLFRRTKSEDEEPAAAEQPV